MKCLGCGKANNEENKYCEFCGIKLEQINNQDNRGQSNNVEVNNVVPKQNKKSKVWLYLLIGVLVFFLLIFFLYYVYISKIKNAINGKYDYKETIKDIIKDVTTNSNLNGFNFKLETGKDKNLINGGSFITYTDEEYGGCIISIVTGKYEDYIAKMKETSEKVGINSLIAYEEKNYDDVIYFINVLDKNEGNVITAYTKASDDKMICLVITTSSRELGYSFLEKISPNIKNAIDTYNIKTTTPTTTTTYAITTESVN